MDGPNESIATWRSASEEGSFELAMAALEQVVATLDAGRLPLAESVECFQIGTALAKRCEHFLNEAELQITLLESSDGLS